MSGPRANVPADPGGSGGPFCHAVTPGDDVADPVGDALATAGERWKDRQDAPALRQALLAILARLG